MEATLCDAEQRGAKRRAREQAVKEILKAQASQHVDRADQVSGHERVREELEAARHEGKLRDEIEAAEEMLNRSRKVMEFEEPLLRAQVGY